MDRLMNGGPPLATRRRSASTPRAIGPGSYILASETHELYIGVTNDLERRLAEHTSGQSTPNVLAAIRREKQLKRWSRRRKLELIESQNPGWCDLAEDWL